MESTEQVSIHSETSSVLVFISQQNQFVLVPQLCLWMYSDSATYCRIEVHEL
jgi:hypothetical protein